MHDQRQETDKTDPERTLDILLEIGAIDAEQHEEGVALARQRAAAEWTFASEGTR